MTQSVLFHGTTEEYLNNPFRQFYDLPRYWTTCPFDALGHSEKSTKRYGSNMAVISLADYPEGNFAKAESVGGICGDIKWYHLELHLKHEEVKSKVGRYCLKAKKIKGMAVKNLVQFIEEHFKKEHDHLDSLKAMKYWGLIFPGVQVQIPGYHHLQEKPKRA